MYLPKNIYRYWNIIKNYKWENKERASEELENIPTSWFKVERTPARTMTSNYIHMLDPRWLIFKMRVVDFIDLFLYIDETWIKLSDIQFQYCYSAKSVQFPRLLPMKLMEDAAKKYKWTELKRWYDYTYWKWIITYLWKCHYKINYNSSSIEYDKNVLLFEVKHWMTEIPITSSFRNEKPWLLTNKIEDIDVLYEKRIKEITKSYSGSKITTISRDFNFLWETNG